MSNKEYNNSYEFVRDMGQQTNWLGLNLVAMVGPSSNKSYFHS